MVTGAVTLAEVKKLAAKYIEPIPAQPAPAKVRTVEPIQTGERRTYVQKASVTAPTILLGYHTPASSHADYYALDLLASILAQGESSRLFKGLVDKELALEVYAEQPQSFDPNLFYVYANAASGVSADKLEQALIAEVNRIASNGVSKEELDKVRNFKLMQFYREMETINGKANMLGTYELYFGSYQRLFDAPSYYNKVSSADIQRVAKTYLKKSNRSVAVLDAKRGLRFMKFSVKLVVQSVTVATALLLTSMLQAAPAFQFPAYEKVQLENGLTIYLLEQHEVPLMTVNVTVKAGAILDNKPGLASLNRAKSNAGCW